nr:hypothetical protein HK105_008317 [Polyrhizophydium stewartii]
MLTPSQRQELDREHAAARLALRRELSDVLDILKKKPAFRVFLRSLDRDGERDRHRDRDRDRDMQRDRARGASRAPLDLAAVEDRVLADLYETPDGFLRDIDLVAQSALAVGDGVRGPFHRDMNAKAMRLRDEALELVGQIPRELVQASWYFYVLARSSVLSGPHDFRGGDPRIANGHPGRPTSPTNNNGDSNSQVGEGDDDMADDLDNGGSDEITPSPDISSGGAPAAATSAAATTPNTCARDQVSRLVDWLVAKTAGLVAAQIEDVCVALASAVVAALADRGSMSADAAVERVWAAARSLLARC